MEKRHKLTRAERLARLDEDLTYTASQLDRDVVAEDQIRTVLCQFRDQVLPQVLPGRGSAETLVFAKDDSHADDIVRVAREVFHEGNDFCQKITYRTGFTKRTQSRGQRRQRDRQSPTGCAPRSSRPTRSWATFATATRRASP